MAIINVSRHQLTFWERLYFPEVFRGLMITGRHLVTNLLHRRRMPIFSWPEVKRPFSSKYRSEHRLMLRPDKTPRCTACMLCQTACPAHCIDIEAKEHPDPRVEKFPVKFDIDLLRCVFCGLCVEACPCDAIRMDTGKMDMAGFTRTEFVVDLNYLLKNHPSGKDPHSKGIY